MDTSMSNWITNNLTVSGDTEQIAKFFSECFTGTVINFEKINPAYKILSAKEFSQKYETYLTSICDHWKKTTEDHYYGALGQGPPILYKGNGFFAGKAEQGDVHAFFQKKGDSYFTANQRLSTSRKQILLSCYNYMTRFYPELLSEKNIKEEAVSHEAVKPKALHRR
jgi:hypothetical protein